MSLHKQTTWKMEFISTVTILLALIIFVHGSPYENGTKSDDNVTQTEPPVNEDDSTYWCPEGLRKHPAGYYCYTVPAPNLAWNNLSSCLNISSENISKGWELRCDNLTDEFLTCEKEKLRPGMYTVDFDKGIKDDNGMLFAFGSFYIAEDDSAIVCAAAITSCKPLDPKLLAASRVAAEGSVKIGELSIVLNDRRYFLKDSFGESLEQVCLPLSKDFTGCSKIILILGEHAWIQEDWTLLTDINETIPYDMYILLYGGTVAYCLPTQPSPVIGHVYAAATIISVVFLLLTLVLHQLVPVINTKDKSLLCHMLSLMIAYIALVVTYYGFPGDGTRLFNAAACTTVYIIFHVFILAAFFWLNVTTFQLWRIFKNLGCAMPHSKKSNTTFILSCLYAFGIPVLVCSITLAINWSEKMQQALGINPKVDILCSLNKDKSMLVLLYIPMSIVLLANLVFFGMTVYNLIKAGSGAKLVNKDIYKQLLHVAIKLFFVMGLCWIMEVVSYVVGGNDSHWYFTDTINGLQGVFIFIVYVCKRRTYEAVRDRFFPGLKKSTSEKTTSTSGNSNEKQIGGIQLRKISKIQSN